MPVKDKEAHRAYIAAYRATHRAEIKARSRAYYLANREKIDAYNRAWRTTNAERMKEAIRKWGENNPVRFDFLQQRAQAKRRGVQFLLSFDEWLDIWQSSGKLEHRGCRKGQYVMARYGDSGAYAVGNVHICTCQENNSDQARYARERRHGKRGL